jgi:hypothetical protein
MPLSTTKKGLAAVAVGSLPFLAAPAAHADSLVAQQVSFTFEDTYDTGTTRTTCIFDYGASQLTPTESNPYTTVEARVALNTGASDPACPDRVTELSVTAFYRPEPGTGTFLSSTGRSEGSTAASVRVRDEGTMEVAASFTVGAKVDDPCRPCVLDAQVPAPK